MAVVKLNVFAEADEAVVREAAACVDLLENAGIRTFPRMGRRLHVTLFMTDYPGGSEEAVVAAARRVASPVGLTLVTDGLRVTKDGWVFLEIVPSAELAAATVAYAEMLAPMRDFDQQPPSWMVHYREKARSFDSWGSPNVGEQFEPHFTLVARAEAGAVRRVFGGETRLPRGRVLGRVAAVGVGVADELGQIVRVISGG